MSKVVALVLSEYENYGEHANLPVYNANGNLVGWTGGELPGSGHVCEHAALDGEGFPACYSSSEIVKLRDENAKLRELVKDMFPFAEVGVDDTCVARRCCLFDQCTDDAGGKCAIEQYMLDRMWELGVEVDE